MGQNSECSRPSSLLRVTQGWNLGADWGCGFTWGQDPLRLNQVVGRFHLLVNTGQRFPFSDWLLPRGSSQLLEAVLRTQPPPQAAHKMASSFFPGQQRSVYFCCCWSWLDQAFPGKLSFNFTQRQFIGNLSYICKTLLLFNVASLQE